MVWLIIVKARFNLKELDSKMSIGIMMRKPNLKEHRTSKKQMLMNSMELKELKLDKKTMYRIHPFFEDSLVYTMGDWVQKSSRLWVSLNYKYWVIYSHEEDHR